MRGPRQLYASLIMEHPGASESRWDKSELYGSPD
jgi:hypothetical protein